MTERSDRRITPRSCWPENKDPFDCSILKPKKPELDRRPSSNIATKAVEAAASKVRVYNDGYTMLIAPRTGGGWMSEVHPSSQRN